MQTIRIARLRSDAILPTRKHPTDAGLDLYAVDPIGIPPTGMGIAKTGITVEILPGYMGLVKPKSRNNHLVGAGVIDAGYQGEVLIKIVNPTDHPLEIRAGDAIAQLVILPVETPTVIEVEAEHIHARATQRGSSGGILDQA